MLKKLKSKELASLGTFEISKYLLGLAEDGTENNLSILNAGQGDPNWINTKARMSFNLIVEFGIKESRKTISDADLAGYVLKEDIGERFECFLSTLNCTESKFLKDSLDYVHHHFSINKDDIVFEWVNGAIGNNYPTPSRVLKNTERILGSYLESTLYPNTHLAQQTDVFPTEGGTAAIVYIFQTLRENHLISPGDKIAINTPIFPPYLEIPELNDYKMIEFDFQSTEEDNWQINTSEMEKLKDPSIKALFLVNPSNPGSKAFDKNVLDTLERVIKYNPDLMIITDDVYGTFVDDFKSVYGCLPYNTLLVYSFSKLFGAAGWRLGTIAAHKKNIFDKKISQLDAATKKQLNTRYGSDSSDPSNMKFIDRLVADSRSIGLYHTAGLSTPQQIMETLFALTHLVEQEKKDSYIDLSKNIITQRYENLHDSLSMKKDASMLNSKYYTLIDIFEVAENLYGESFKEYLQNTYETIDIMMDLAIKKHIILAYGPGFSAPSGYLRVSEANLPTDDYTTIGKRMIDLFDEYYQDFEKHIQ